VSEFRSILTKYWGFSQFRPLQEDIIKSVAEGKDTLGLMPTGGGKSVTFQVYSLSREGVCLVITPLIALMKDQVQNLKKRKIKAAAIYSGMSKDEIDITFENVVNGNFKFLYLSPERLQTDFFKRRLHLLNVNLIAVDEAHCISQWGHDFRPSYRTIAEIRDELPAIPVLALTATATPQVVDDIQEQLHFVEKNVFSKSFERNNLTYSVLNTENKIKHLFKIVTDNNGTGIVYARNRKATREIALNLKKYNFSADYYHAGLDPELRTIKQTDWQKGKTRIMVCTNAFGMGIDKPDVRFVVHMDLPDSIEEYFQEAGRAGRDEKEAKAILLYNNTDNTKALQRITRSFPEIEKVKVVYQALADYFQIALEEGVHESFEFEIFNFAQRYKLDVLTIFNSLKLLQTEGYLEYNDAVYNPSRIFFKPNRDDLYKFQVSHRNLDPFIKLLLRNYTGVFTEFVNISEEGLARKAGAKVEIIVNYLILLSKEGIINYIPRKTKPVIVFLKERCKPEDLYFNIKDYNQRKNRYESRLKAMLKYAQSTTKCRSQQLLAYFGQNESSRCGKCDICMRRNELSLSKYEFDLIHKKLKDILSEKDIYLNDAMALIDDEENKVVKVIQWLFENNKIIYSKEHKLQWKSNCE
jgi:ATP-dependent DNA helicase RecQ